MTLTAVRDASPSTVALQAQAEAHEKAARVLAQRNPLAAARHTEQARAARAGTDGGGLAG